MAFFFTSDQHFGHANVIKYSKRPFRTNNVFKRLREIFTDKISPESVQIMNEELVRRFNSVVGPNDTTFHLGDFSMNFQNMAQHIFRLNGTHYLVSGNHDRTHPAHHKDKEPKKSKALADYIAAGFSDVQLERKIRMNSVTFKMNHMPYTGDHTQDVRFPKWRPKDEGEWLLHGHVHEHWKVRDRMINVGVDVWDYYPVPLEKILEIVNS